MAVAGIMYYGVLDSQSAGTGLSLPPSFRRISALPMYGISPIPFFPTEHAWKAKVFFLWLAP